MPLPRFLRPRQKSTATRLQNLPPNIQRLIYDKANLTPLQIEGLTKTSIGPYLPPQISPENKQVYNKWKKQLTESYFSNERSQTIMKLTKMVQLYLIMEEYMNTAFTHERINWIYYGQLYPEYEFMEKLTDPAQLLPGTGYLYYHNSDDLLRQIAKKYRLNIYHINTTKYELGDRVKFKIEFNLQKNEYNYSSRYDVGVTFFKPTIPPPNDLNNDVPPFTVKWELCMSFFRSDLDYRINMQVKTMYKTVVGISGSRRIFANKRSYVRQRVTERKYKNRAAYGSVDAAALIVEIFKRHRLPLPKPEPGEERYALPGKVVTNMMMKPPTRGRLQQMRNAVRRRMRKQS